MIATEQDDLLRHWIVGQTRVGSRWRLAVERERTPGVLFRRVDPRPGITAFGRDVAAAEEDETLPVGVVAHRTPEQDAAQFAGGIGGRIEVFPSPRCGVVGECFSMCEEVELFGIGVIVVLLPERERAVDGPVRSGVSLDVAEIEVLVLPSGSLCRSTQWPPVLARRELILPHAVRRVPGENIIGPRLLVLPP